MSEWASIQIQLLLKLNNDDAQLCEVRKANSNTTLVKVKSCFPSLLVFNGLFKYNSC